MEPIVLYQSTNGVCHLTLNRPEVFNALNLQLVQDLASALKRAESEVDVRVIVLKGAGKAWWAGGDLGEMWKLTAASAAERRVYLRDFQAMIDTVRRMSKPIIAARHGVCIGGGNALNIACDLTIASENA
ncbi:MAG: enoyl-CoA hydratase/isomerase family protein, partial [Desulfobacterales bacterium]